MKTKKIFNTTCIALVFFLSVSISVNAQTTIPATWQPGMKLTMTYGGGMRYYSSLAEISDSGSYLLVDKEGVQKKHKLSITKKQRDDLAKFLVANRFNKIESHMEGVTDDKGSETILLSWNGNYVGVSDNNSIAISAESRNDYNAVRDYVNQLVEKTKGKGKKIKTGEVPKH